LTSVKNRLLADRKALLDLGTRNRLINIPLRTKNIRAIEIIDEKTPEVFRILGEGKRFTFLPAETANAENDSAPASDALLQPVETLSKGFKRRVGLAQALLHDPPVLVLDEPTDGLDPNQKHEVRTLIAQMAPDKAIVISTHILEEVDAVCTRAIIIAAGRVVADATPAELQSRHPSGKLDDVFRQMTTEPV